MAALTWLPRDLKERVAALDPAQGGTAPPPPIEVVVSRGAGDDATGSLMPPPGPALAPDSSDSRAPRRWALASSVSLVAVIVTVLVIGIAQRRPGQPSTSPSGTRDIAALLGVTWIDLNSRATVVFHRGTAHTSDGCSGMTQRLLLRQHHLTLGRRIGSGYTCGGAAGPAPDTPGYAAYRRQQQAVNHFYQVLDASPHWSITGKTLTLTARSGTTLRLTSRGTAPLTLPGSRWTLLDVTSLNPGGLSGAFRGPTLAFDRTGGFTASDSCNTLSGKAVVAGDQVAFSDVVRTHRACAETIRSGTIRTIDVLLSGAVTYQVEDNTLRLRKPNTEGGLIYAPADR